MKKQKINPRGRVHDWRRLLKKIGALRSESYTVKEACKEAGIATSTYYEWKKRNPKT